uniref:Dachshund family transcription factor 1 n=1 Tax=Apteryx owenii TaxID=8824 RepID=A0A8B9SAL9_APTOW
MAVPAALIPPTQLVPPQPPVSTSAACTTTTTTSSSATSSPSPSIAPPPAASGTNLFRPEPIAAAAAAAAAATVTSTTTGGGGGGGREDGGGGGGGGGGGDAAGPGPVPGERRRGRALAALNRARAQRAYSCARADSCSAGPGRGVRTRRPAPSPREPPRRPQPGGRSESPAQTAAGSDAAGQRVGRGARSPQVTGLNLSDEGKGSSSCCDSEVRALGSVSSPSALPARWFTALRGGGNLPRQRRFAVRETSPKCPLQRPLPVGAHGQTGPVSLSRCGMWRCGRSRHVRLRAGPRSLPLPAPAAASPPSPSPVQLRVVRAHQHGAGQSAALTPRQPLLRGSAKFLNIQGSRDRTAWNNFQALTYCSYLGNSIFFHVEST